MENIYYIVIAIIIILLIVIFLQTEKKHFKNLPNTHYTKLYEQNDLKLASEQDYKELFGDTLKYLKQGKTVKEAITLSFHAHRDACFRKVQRVDTAILRYLKTNNDTKDPDLIKEILSAITYLTPDEKNKLIDILINPDKYKKPFNKMEITEKYTDFYSSYLNMRNGVQKRLEIYGTEYTWLYAIPENIQYKNNNVARYFWMNMKAILLTPEVFVQESQTYKEIIPQFKDLLEASNFVDKNKLIQIDFYNEYL